jgi:thermitase
MRYLFTVGVLLMIASGCNMSQTTDSQQPTFTPLPNIIPIATEPVAVNNATPVANCDTIVSDIQAQRAEISRTLPNGKPFPGKSPRTIENNGKGHQRQDGRIEVMIQFTPDSAPNERNQYIHDIGGTSRRKIDALNTYVAVLKPNSTLQNLPESAIVIQAEINSTAIATQINAPNDPRYAEQWSLSVIGLPQAWESVSSNTVTIAVIDSGVCSNHPDLQGRIIAGYDFVDEDSDPSDTFGHGCGVVGVIAANSNNNIGIAGTTPAARIMPLRVLDSSGLGNYADISAAIVHATDNGADIINMSLAGTNYSQVMADAIAYAVSRGVQIVASAGNHGSDGIFYPAAYPSVVSVGSIDPDLSHSSFSNYGANVDVWAPGRDILTTAINGDYEFMSGTSFASPLVAGIMALAETSNTTLDSADGIAFIYPDNDSTDCS